MRHVRCSIAPEYICCPPLRQSRSDAGICTSQKWCSSITPPLTSARRNRPMLFSSRGNHGCPSTCTSTCLHRQNQKQRITYSDILKICSRYFRQRGNGRSVYGRGQFRLPERPLICRWETLSSADYTTESSLRLPTSSEGRLGISYLFLTSRVASSRSPSLMEAS